MARFTPDSVGTALGGTSAPASPPPSDGPGWFAKRRQWLKDRYGDTRAGKWAGKVFRRPTTGSGSDPNMFNRPSGPLAWGRVAFVVLLLLGIAWLVQGLLIDRLEQEFPHSHTHIPDQPIFYLLPGPFGWVVNLVFGGIAVWCLVVTALSIVRVRQNKPHPKTNEPSTVAWAPLWWGLSLLPFTLLAVVSGVNELGVVAYALVVAAFGLIGWIAWWAGAKSAARHAGPDAKVSEGAKAAKMRFGLLAVVLLLMPTGHGWAWHIDNTSRPADHGPNFAEYCVEYQGNLLACANGELQDAQAQLANYTSVKATCKNDQPCLDQLRTDGRRENFKSTIGRDCFKAERVHEQLSDKDKKSLETIMKTSCGDKVKAFYNSPPNSFVGDLS